eukprot:1157666-Pelagomonas_calceolata.AAC.2
MGSAAGLHFVLHLQAWVAKLSVANKGSFVGQYHQVPCLNCWSSPGLAMQAHEHNYWGGTGFWAGLCKSCLPCSNGQRLQLRHAFKPCSTRSTSEQFLCQLLSSRHFVRLEINGARLPVPSSTLESMESSSAKNTVPRCRADGHQGKGGACVLPAHASPIMAAASSMTKHTVILQRCMYWLALPYGTTNNYLKKYWRTPVTLTPLSPFWPTESVSSSTNISSSGTVAAQTEILAFEELERRVRARMPAPAGFSAPPPPPPGIGFQDDDDISLNTVFLGSQENTEGPQPSALGNWAGVRMIQAKGLQPRCLAPCCF